MPVEGFLPVRVMIPLEQYKMLAEVAARRSMSVGALVTVITMRAMTKTTRMGPYPKKQRAKYTPELGARIEQARWFHHSWGQIARDEGIDGETARDYAARYERENPGSTREL